MKSLSLVRFVIVLVLASPMALFSEEPVRFLSYNIHAGVGSDGELNLERIAKVIRDSRADIVALQEVDRGTNRSDKRDLANELGELTAMQAVFGASMEYDDGYYGNAFLIRPDSGWKITSSNTHAIPVPDEKEPRSVLELQLTCEREAMPTLTVFSTHWCHIEAANRLGAAAFINQMVSVSNGTAILMGDLNATPKSPPLTSLLDAGWLNPSARELPTVPVSSPKRQIDYVLLRTTSPWKAHEITVLDRPHASDHLPLLTVIEFLALEESQ